jgi:hypothetical protein
MHTVELLEQALQVADQLGYSIRHEWLGGAGGGACEIRGRKWLFVDLALNAVEQLEQVAAVLQADAAVYTVELPPAMRRLLGIRKSA